MNKLLVIISFALAIFATNQIVAQEWNLVTPVKNNSKLKAVWMTSDSVCYAIDMMEHRILKTTDAGITWKRKYFYMSSQPYDLWMFNETSGIICASSGYIYKSSDGFETYSLVTTGQGNLYSLWFTSNLVGYATGESGKILKTTNGGDSWTLLSTGVTDILFNVFFVNDTIGYACGNSGRLIRTTDAGNSWTTMTTGTTTRLTDVWFSDPAHGVLVGSGGLMMNTADSGFTWTPMVSGTTQYIFNITQSGTILTAACAGGVLLRSVNQGATWTASTYGSRDHYMACFSSNGKGFTGSDACMYTTTNSGNSWSLHQGGAPNSGLNKVSFADNNTGVAVGMMGLNNAVIRTTNGGHSWSTISANSTSSAGILGVHLLPDGTGCYGGSSGLNAHTNNYGQNFTFGANHPVVAVRAVWAFDENKYILGGGYINAGIYKTTNGGATAFTYTPGGNIYDFYFPSDSVGYAVGEGGSIMKTIDQGNSWTGLTTGFFGDLNSVFFLNDSLGFVAGSGSRKTTDGGATWIPIFPAGTSVMSIFFCTPDSGYAVTYGGTVVKTIDGGANWTSIVDGLTDQSVGDATLVNGYIVAVGGMGDVYTLKLFDCDTYPTPILTLSNDTIFSNQAFDNQWYNSSGLISGATGSYYVTTENDYYYSIASSSFGCVSDTSNIIDRPCSVIPAPIISLSGDTLFSDAASGNQWYNSSGLIPGATSNYYVPMVSGDYFVMVTNIYGCHSDSSDVYHFVVSSFSESDNAEIIVFPVPADKLLSIDSKTLDIVLVSIYALDGRLWVQFSPQSPIFKTDVSAICNGVYVLQLETTHSIIRKKIVIQH